MFKSGKAFAFLVTWNNQVEDKFLAMQKTIFKAIVLTAMCFFTLAACDTASQMRLGEDETVSTEFNELIDLLRREPGLDIRGNGDQVSIYVRGNRKFSGEQDEVLFVVNGSPAGQGYAAVGSSINVQDVASINVLPPSRAALYGARGAFGVVEIKTK